MDRLGQDLRFTLRMLRRSPAFTLTVLLTLGIGIGANTAIFSFVDTLLLRPLPYPSPAQIVTLWQDFSASGGPAQEWFTPPDYRDVREQAGTIQAVTPLVNWQPSLTGQGDPERLAGAVVAADWFDVTGVAPAHGRAFDADDEVSDASVVVLSHGLWQRRFGGDPGVIGRVIQLSGRPYEVVGIMPEGFRPPLLTGVEIWRPFTATTFAQGCAASRGCYVMRVIARIGEGATLAQAQAELDNVAVGIREAAPEEKTGLALRAVPLHEQVVAGVRPALLALLAAVGLLLLIACVNIANLLLARSATREREVAVRTAIGAGRRTILRQLLVESTLLGLLGGSVGLLLSLWGVQTLRLLSPPGTPRLDEVAVDARALGFAFAISLLTGILFGLAPALQLARTDLTRVLREGLTPRAGGARRRIRGALVVAQLAIALALLAGAGLLVRSFMNLQSVDPGFRPDGVLVANVSFPSSRYPEPGRTSAVIADLVETLASRDDVIAAGASTIVPLAPGDNDISFLIEGRPEPADRTQTPVAWYRQVTTGYFDAIGIRLIAGRAFTDEDREGGMPVGVVNETLARRWWPEDGGTGAIGARITTDPARPWVTVVGIVADVRQAGPDQPPKSELFLPLAQVPASGAALVIRASGDPLTLVPAVRAAVRQIDPELPLANVSTLRESARQAVAMPRLYLSFFVFFSIVALVLAAVGTYGVTAWAVVQRTPEIGVRMAMGADRGDILRMVLRQAFSLVGLGLAAGLLLALALSRLLSGLLFGISPTDPLTFASLSLLLALVALFASWLPARRATRVDPLRALRTDT